MTFFALLRRESSLSFVRAGGAAAVAGIASALLLAVINAAGSHSSDSGWNHLHLAYFLAALAAWAVAQRYLLVVAAREVESLLDRLRVRLADKLRHAELRGVERLDRTRLYGALARETALLSQSGPILVTGLQSAIQLAFIALYLAWLSPLALVLTAVVTGLSALHYLRTQHRARHDLEAASHEQDRLLGAFADLLDGFKEVKLSVPRGDDLLAELAATSARASEWMIAVQEQRAGLYVLAQRSLFLLAAAIVFLVPRMAPVWQGMVVQATTAIFFLYGPLSAVVGLFVTLATADHAARNLDALERQLDAAADPSVPSSAPSAALPATFRELGLVDARFELSGDGDRSFAVGPVDLDVARGELVMISGGNGSGKSTLLRLLTSLYPPQSGHLHLDGEVVPTAAYPAYRGLFSAVFADYHLFRRLYAVPADPARVAGLLEELGLAGKTRLDGDRFTHLELSTGQRKRLALLVALLEDRPVYVFDEWAAEQDPEFRGRFYRDILQRLKANGKTVVAVTHDDQYFHLADRMLRMRDGRFVDLPASATGPAAEGDGAAREPR